MFRFPQNHQAKTRNESFMTEILTHSQTDPNYLYKPSISYCDMEGCGCCMRNTPIEKITHLSMDNIKKLVELGYLDLTKPAPFYEWISTAEHTNYGNFGEKEFHLNTIYNVLDLIDLYLEHSKESADMIVSYRNDYGNSVITMLATAGHCFNPESFLVRYMHKFAEKGMDFSDHYWIVWSSMFSNSDVIDFLFTHGMTLENALTHQPNGTPVPVGQEYKNCITKGIKRAIGWFDEEEELGRTDYRLFWTTLRVLVYFGLTKIPWKTTITYNLRKTKTRTIMLTWEQILSKVKNPYWDWSKDFNDL